MTVSNPVRGARHPAPLGPFVLVNQANEIEYGPFEYWRDAHAAQLHHGSHTTPGAQVACPPLFIEAL